MKTSEEVQFHNNIRIEGLYKIVSWNFSFKSIMMLILVWLSFISKKCYQMLPDRDMLLTDGNQYLLLIWKNKGQMKVDYVLSPFTFISSTRGPETLLRIQNVLELNLLFIPRTMSFQMINMFFWTAKTRSEILIHQKLMQKDTVFAECRISYKI